MIFIKIYYHLTAFIKYAVLLLLYGNKLSIGKRTTFRRNFSVIIGCSGRIIIGTDCFFNHDCSLSSRGKIEIGNGNLFGENVKFYDHNHKFAGDAPIKLQGYSVGKICIGNHCWIGSNVTFLKGANVGDGCVIGTGCIINDTIPPWTVVTTEQQKIYRPIKKEKICKIIN